MKKLLVVLVTVALICGLGLTTPGCGKKDAKTTTTPAATVTTTKTTT